MLKIDNRVFVLRLVRRFRFLCVLDDSTVLDAKNTWSMAVLECHSLLLRRVVRQPSLSTGIRAHTLSFETGGERRVGIAFSRDAGGFLDLGCTRWNEAKSLADTLEEWHRETRIQVGAVLYLDC